MNSKSGIFMQFYKWWQYKCWHVLKIIQVKVLAFSGQIICPRMCLKPLVKVIMAHESFIVFCVRDIIFTAYWYQWYLESWQIFYGAEERILCCNIERQSGNSVAQVWAPCKKGCLKEFRTSHCLWMEIRRYI